MRSLVHIVAVALLLFTVGNVRAEEKRGYLGVLFARQAANLAAEVSGTIKQVNVRLGDPVEAGDLLVKMDVPELTPEIARAEAALSATVAEIGRYQTEFDDVSRKLERRKQTREVFSEDEIRALETQKAVAEANLDVARSNVKQRRATVDELLKKKELLEIRAPFAGAIAACYTNPGEFVSVGTQVVRILSVNDLWARFAVPEEEAVWLKVGATVTITPDGQSAPVWSAEIRQISPEIDASIGVVIAEAALSAIPPEQRLPVGAVVRIRRTPGQEQD